MAMSQALSEEEFHRMQVRKTTAIVLLGRWALTRVGVSVVKNTCAVQHHCQGR